MADYFEKFGTTTAKVVAWAGPLGFAVTDEVIAAAGAHDGAPPAHAKPLSTAELRAKVDLRKYAKGRDLKAGVFGQTSLLVSNTPGDPVLVTKTPANVGSRNELVKEAKMYEKAGDHPNIAKCLGMQNINGRECLVLEAIPGKDMAGTSEALRAKYESGKISHEQFWGATQHMVASMLKAAAHLESKGIVHNDLRLDNVMCDGTTGDVKVIDFGISVDSEAGEKAAMAPFGHGTVSPDFARGMLMAPAAKREATLDPKHDVFAVGATAYHMGEQGKFRSHQESLPEEGNIPVPVIASFASPDKDGKMKQAIRNVPPSKPSGDGQPPPVPPVEASKVVDGKRQKTRGLAAAQTEYTKFVNWLMTPVNGRRPSAAQALQHPFITDSILDEDSAKEAIRAALAPAKPKPAPAPVAPPPPAPVTQQPAGDASRYAMPEDSEYDEPEEGSDVEDTNAEDSDVEDSDIEEDSHVEDSDVENSDDEEADAHRSAQPGRSSYDMLDKPPAKDQSGDSQYDMLDESPADEEPDSHPQQPAPTGHSDSDALRGGAQPGRGGYDMLDEPEK